MVKSNTPPRNTYKVKYHQILMMQTRGYIIEDSELKFLREYPDFTENIELNKDYYKSDGYSSHVMYGENTKQVSRKTIDKFIAKSTGYKAAILITVNPINASSEESIMLPNVKWQVFAYYELTYNPTESVDIPRHKLLTKEHTDQIMKEMGVDYTKLPLINRSDPQIKYYNWPSGHLVEILSDYSWLGIGSSINYRLIVG